VWGKHFKGFVMLFVQQISVNNTATIKKVFCLTYNLTYNSVHGSHQCTAKTIYVLLLVIMNEKEQNVTNRYLDISWSSLYSSGLVLSRNTRSRRYAAPIISSIRTASAIFCNKTSNWHDGASLCLTLYKYCMVTRLRLVQYFLGCDIFQYSMGNHAIFILSYWESVFFCRLIFKQSLLLSWISSH